jgi:hypothetical protein
LFLGVGQIQWSRKRAEHAHEAAKEVYVVWTAGQSPSVFVTQTATKVFTEINNALEFFKKKKYINPD